MSTPTNISNADKWRAYLALRDEWELKLNQCTTAKERKAWRRRKPHRPTFRAALVRKDGVDGKWRMGRPNIELKVEAAIRRELAKGTGINKTAKLCGAGNGTAARIKYEMETEERRLSLPPK